MGKAEKRMGLLTSAAGEVVLYARVANKDLFRHRITAEQYEYLRHRSNFDYLPVRAEAGGTQVVAIEGGVYRAYLEQIQ